MNGDAERVGFTCEAFSARLRDVPRIERWPTATRELCVARFTLEPGQHKTLERRRAARTARVRVVVLGYLTWGSGRLCL